MSEEKIEAETYSLIFSSLKHPIRRRILRMLAKEPQGFSEILNSLSIDSGHLSYHLESLGDLIMHTPDGKYGLSSIGVAAVKLMSGVEEHPPLPLGVEEKMGAPVRKFHMVSRKWAMLLIPFVLLPSFWLFQQAAIDSKIFLELTFSSFIFLGIGALLLLASKIEKASTKIKCMLYAITLLSLIVTALAANSLAEIPRGWSTGGSPPYGNPPSHSHQPAEMTGVGEVEQIIYTVNYSVGYTTLLWYGMGGLPSKMQFHIYLSADVVLNGTIVIALILEPWTQGSHIFDVEGSISRIYKEPIRFNGNYTCVSVDQAFMAWGGAKPNDRIRASGYRIKLMLRLTLSGSAVYFRVRPDIIVSAYDVPVDSELQNGLALVLCGVFAGIYTGILGKGIIQTMKKQEKTKLNH